MTLKIYANLLYPITIFLFIMIVIDFEKLPHTHLGATIITIGNFDGVHAGHQELIKQAVLDAQKRKLKSVVLTFHPHPATFFQPDRTPPSICSKEYKEKLIKALGVDVILTLNFNAKLAKLDAEEYVKTILLEKLNIKVIWIGYDFTFGRNRTGNVRLLIELGEKHHFQTNVLGPQRIESIVVSSTKIRELIIKGKVEDAAKLLKRKHIVHGNVVPGDGKGHALGYPTINMNVTEGLIPTRGIYSGIAFINNLEYPAAVYIGSRPTYKGNDFRVEAHLLGFSGNLYGTKASIAFLKFQRSEAEFDNIEMLKNNIKLDCKAAQNDFNFYKQNNQGIPIIW